MVTKTESSFSTLSEIWLDHMGRERQVFTTGQIAKLAKVAPRTVSKWFDSGLLKGWRIPGSDDRRISRQDWLDFCKEHNLPLIGYVEHISVAVLVIGCNLNITAPPKSQIEYFPDFFRCYNKFDPFAISHKVAVVADAAISRLLTQQFFESLQERTPGKLFRLFLFGDMGDDEIAYAKENRSVSDCFQSFEVPQLESAVAAFAADDEPLEQVAKRYKLQNRKKV